MPRCLQKAATSRRARHPPERPRNDSAHFEMFSARSIPGHRKTAGNIKEIRRLSGHPCRTAYAPQMQIRRIGAQRRIPFAVESIPEFPRYVLSGGPDAYRLRHPTYNRRRYLGYGPLHPDAMLSPRACPRRLSGLGLLEAIPAGGYSWKLVDPNGCGIGTGFGPRQHCLVAKKYNKCSMLGRFGPKGGYAHDPRAISSALPR